MLGVPPVLGRDFQAADDRLNGPNVVVLSDALWRRRFDGDRAIVGRQITLDDNSYLVLGVMPHGFENVLAPSAELWAPLAVRPVAGTGVGPSPAHRGTPQAGRQHQITRRERSMCSGRIVVKAASGGVRPRRSVHGPFAARRCHTRRQTGAPGHPWRSDPRARDRVRERDEPAPRPRCAPARRVRAARRARRRTQSARPSTAH